MPKGAVQIRTKRPSNFTGYNRDRITAPVLEVVDGNFPDEEIRLNLSNIDDCNSYLFTSLLEKDEAYYVTALPLLFPDGEPVRDNKGSAEYGALFYRDLEFGIFAKTENEVPDFVDYSDYQRFSFVDVERLECILDGDSTAQAWRRCVAQGEYVALECTDSRVGVLVCDEENWPTGRPPELRRGYDPQIDWGTAIPVALGALLTLLIVGGLVHRRQAGDR